MYACIYIYIYIYVYVYMYYTNNNYRRKRSALSHGEPLVHNNQRRENMVGVNMVLAWFVKFKHGLYKSCGIECVEGIMLEACLLQPCFHVAGISNDGNDKHSDDDNLAIIDGYMMINT